VNAALSDHAYRAQLQIPEGPGGPILEWASSKRGKSVGTQVARDVKASDRLGIRKRLCARRPFRQGVVAL
jgi:hypothetical protein